MTALYAALAAVGTLIILAQVAGGSFGLDDDGDTAGFVQNMVRALPPMMSVIEEVGG